MAFHEKRPALHSELEKIQAVKGAFLLVGSLESDFLRIFS